VNIAKSNSGGRRIGLLGGSFNPAHDGHRKISELALKLLNLHEVWWLVSPQNPLKDEDGMAPFSQRLCQAEAAARHRRIHVSGIEADLGTRYTADTLAALVKRYPGHDFVWIMGADNLVQLPHWQRWTEILETVPVAVFDRPSYSHKALAGKAAIRYAGARLAAKGSGRRACRRLAGTPPPAWVFLWAVNDPVSATAIRSTRKG